MEEDQPEAPMEDAPPEQQPEVEAKPARRHGRRITRRTFGKVLLVAAAGAATSGSDEPPPPDVPLAPPPDTPPDWNERLREPLARLDRAAEAFGEEIFGLASEYAHPRHINMLRRGANLIVVPPHGDDKGACALAFKARPNDQPISLPAAAELMRACAEVENLYAEMHGNRPGAELNYQAVAASVLRGAARKTEEKKIPSEAGWRVLARDLLQSTTTAAHAITHRVPAPEKAKRQNDAFREAVEQAKDRNEPYTRLPGNDFHYMWLRNKGMEESTLLGLPDAPLLEEMKRRNDLNPAQRSLIDCAEEHIAALARTRQIELDKSFAVNAGLGFSVNVPLNIYVRDPARPEHQREAENFRNNAPAAGASR